jgi:hypothetical protein
VKIALFNKFELGTHNRVGVSPVRLSLRQNNYGFDPIGYATRRNCSLIVKKVMLQFKFNALKLG